jgi:hypothetical protein
MRGARLFSPSRNIHPVWSEGDGTNASTTVRSGCVVDAPSNSWGVGLSWERLILALRACASATVLYLIVDRLLIAGQRHPWFLIFPVIGGVPSGTPVPVVLKTPESCANWRCTLRSIDVAIKVIGDCGQGGSFAAE